MNSPGLWRLTLDQDLLDTLSRRFPTWFDGATAPNSSSNSNSSSGVSSIDSCASNSPSPPKSEASTTYSVDGQLDTPSGLHNLHHHNLNSVDGGFVSGASTGSPSGTTDSGALCVSVDCCSAGGEIEDDEDRADDEVEEEEEDDEETSDEENDDEEEEEENSDEEHPAVESDHKTEELPAPQLSHSIRNIRQDVLDFFNASSEQYFTVDLVDFNGMADGKFGAPIVSSSSGQPLKEGGCVLLFSGGDGLQVARPEVGVNNDIFVSSSSSNKNHNIDSSNDNLNFAKINFAPPLIATDMTSRRQQSPPKAVVDSSPLQPAMDRNKECKFLNYHR